MSTQLKIQRSLTEVVQEYEAKLNGGEVTRIGSGGVMETIASYRGVDAEVEEFNKSVTAVESASLIEGEYVGPLFDRTPRINVRDMKLRLLKSAWKSIYKGLSINNIATAKDKVMVEMMLENPPEFSIENIREKFGDYLIDQRYHILRGLAEAFADLDPAYRSHNKVKIGVSGLPKRVIIEAAMKEYSHDSYGEGKLRDMIRAFLAYRGLPDMEYKEYRDMHLEARTHGEAEWEGGRIKAYQNGNAHIFFNEDALKDVNRALAEFYGEVLADSPEAKKDVKKRQSTEVSKDLQFYWTPANIVKRMLEKVKPYEGCKILEPSCGDGRIMGGVVSHVIENHIERVSLSGIEYDAGRAEIARKKGYSVLTKNFLDIPSTEMFDIVYMNPPFYGQHYLKHIAKAIDMLKAGGTLVALLPASAWYDHKKLPGVSYNPTKPYAGRDTWTDMPIGSFRETGTNVCTGLWVYRKPKTI